MNNSDGDGAPWRRSARGRAGSICSISANYDNGRANKRVGRKSDVLPNIPSVAHTSRRRGHRRRRRCEPAGRRPQAAAVVVARSCNSEPEPGKAQPYLCRRSSAQPFQIPMRIVPMQLPKISFPFRRSSSRCFRRFNPAIAAKFPGKKRATHSNQARVEFPYSSAVLRRGVSAV